MTVIEKLSDRGGLIFNAIKLILVNEGHLSAKQLQYKLFLAGIYIDGPKLAQALSVMREKGLLTKPEIKDNPVMEKAKEPVSEKPDENPKLAPDLKEKSKIIADVFSKENGQA